MDKLRILVFGQLTDIVTSPEVTLDLYPDTDALKKALLERYPGLASKTFRIAVNNQMADGNMPISPGAVVALLPPFSGG